MTREEFLDRYHRREWLYPDLNYRTIDIDGAEFYWAVRPRLRQTLWVRGGQFADWRRGTDLGRLSAVKYWENSLQSKDEFLNLQKIQNNG